MIEFNLIFVYYSLPFSAFDTSLNTNLICCIFWLFLLLILLHNESLICLNCDCVICKIYFSLLFVKWLESFFFTFYSLTMTLLSSTIRTIFTLLIDLNIAIIIETNIIVSLSMNNRQISTNNIVKSQFSNTTIISICKTLYLAKSHHLIISNNNYKKQNILQTEYRNKCNNAFNVQSDKTLNANMYVSYISFVCIFRQCLFDIRIQTDSNLSISASDITDINLVCLFHSFSSFTNIHFI